MFRDSFVLCPVSKAVVQQQLAFRFGWDTIDQVMQNKTRMSRGNDPVPWSALTEASPEQIADILDTDELLDVLLVADITNVERLGEWYKHVKEVISFRRPDLLIELKGTIDLQHIRSLGRELPWRPGSISELGRPINLSSRENISVLVVRSTPQERESGLSAKVTMMNMSEVGAALTALETATPPPPPEMFAVQIGNKILHQVMKCMGKSGSEWKTYPSRTPEMARVVYHKMEQEELSDMMEHVNHTPYFGVMRSTEYFGHEFSSCLIVIHSFPCGRNEELSEQIWNLLWEASCKILDRSEFCLQVVARGRVKIGFNSQFKADEWLRDVMPELIVRGLKFIDNKRRNRGPVRSVRD